jgi:hypothetical protein
MKEELVPHIRSKNSESTGNSTHYSNRDFGPLLYEQIHLVVFIQENTDTKSLKLLSKITIFKALGCSGKAQVSGH